MNESNKAKKPNFWDGVCFAPEFVSVWVVETAEGPVVRMWIPRMGWHCCRYIDGTWHATVAISAAPFTKLIIHCFTEVTTND